MARNSFTLPARSLVLTADGFKKAQDVHIGDFVIDADGHANAVVETANGGPLNCASILIGNDERHQLSGDNIMASCFAKNDNGVMSMEPAVPRCPHDLESPEAMKFNGAPVPPFNVTDDDEELLSFDYVCSPTGPFDKVVDVPDFTDYELWLLGLYASNGTSSTYVVDDERTTVIEFNANDRVSKDLLLLRHVESMAGEAAKGGVKTETTPDMEHAVFSAEATDEKSFAYRAAQMYGSVAGTRQVDTLVPDEYRIDWTADTVGIPVGVLSLDNDKLDKFLEGYCQDFAPLGGVPRSAGVPCRSLADALMLRLIIHQRYGCRAFLTHNGQITVSDYSEFGDEMPVPTHTYDMWSVAFDSTDAAGSAYADAFDEKNSYRAYCVSRAMTERHSDDCIETVVEDGETVIQDSLIVFGQEVEETDEPDVDEIEEIMEAVEEPDETIDDDIVEAMTMDDDEDDDVVVIEEAKLVPAAIRHDDADGDKDKDDE